MEREPQKIGFAKNVPIFETENSVAYLGVELAKGEGGEFCPKKEAYQGTYINDEFSLALQQKIALAWKLDQPLLIEGGPSIGKATTVKKMCADLGWEAYYINLRGIKDPEDLVGWNGDGSQEETAGGQKNNRAYGPMARGLRPEKGKTKVIILDQFHDADPKIASWIQEILRELEDNSGIILSPGASEKVRTDKARTKIVALARPRDSESFSGEHPDPPDLRHWVYLKEATELPPEIFSGAVDSTFSLTPVSKEPDEKEYLFPNSAEIPAQKLLEIPGMKEFVEKYKQFHTAAKDLLKKKKGAEGRPSQFLYDDRAEPSRVLKFIQNFYCGDAEAVWKDALRYLYANKLADEVDRQRLLKLIEEFGYGASQKDTEEIATLQRETAASTPKKREALDGTLSEQMRSAREILGEREVFGPAEIKMAFGIELQDKDIPAIPFSKEDLARAKELNQHLILRTDKAQDGTALTMKKMYEMLAPEFERKEYGDILWDAAWFRKENFFTAETPQFSWALAGKSIIAGTEEKNYLEQTEEIIKYLKEQAFRDMDIPKEYQDAISEFAAKKNEIEKFLEDDWQEAAKMLEDLTITKLTRHSPAEFFYDMLICFKNSRDKEWLFDRKMVNSSGRTSTGEFVSIGQCGFDGMSILDYGPGSSYDSACFSRII